MDDNLLDELQQYKAKEKHRREYMQKYMRRRYYNNEEHRQYILRKSKERRLKNKGINTLEQDSSSPPVPEKSQSGQKSEVLTIFPTDAPSGQTPNNDNWDIELT